MPPSTTSLDNYASRRSATAPAKRRLIVHHRQLNDHVEATIFLGFANQPGTPVGTLTMLPQDWDDLQHILLSAANTQPIPLQVGFRNLDLSTSPKRPPAF